VIGRRTFLASALVGAGAIRVAALSKDDEAFLEDLSKRSFLYFWEQGDSHTGLVPDRAKFDGGVATGRAHNVASIAATGFGLTGLCIAAERHWITEDQALQRAQVTLRFLAGRLPNEHGFYYHFVDCTTGARIWASEASSIDTALLLGGVLTVGQRFHRDPEIVRLAELIYRRIDFQWMLSGSPNVLSHGWKPETGFIRYRWDAYCELAILYLLAIGSPAHPIPPDAWYAWWRPRVSYQQYKYVGGGPLFTHQYSHAWVDFRHRQDSGPLSTNYFENSILATHAHRLFCMSLAPKFPKSYGPNLWGITASDSAKGYRAWGGPPFHTSIDGTLVPCAAGGSLMFTPEICLPDLLNMRDTFGAKAYGHYGFIDAFNPTTGWFDSDVLGIDVGITLLSAENLRSGNVWRWFMRNREIPKAMHLARFRRA